MALQMAEAVEGLAYSKRLIRVEGLVMAHWKSSLIHRLGGEVAAEAMAPTSLEEAVVDLHQMEMWRQEVPVGREAEAEERDSSAENQRCQTC